MEVREGTRRTEKGKEEHAAKSKAEGPKPGLWMTPRKEVRLENEQKTDRGAGPETDSAWRRDLQARCPRTSKCKANGAMQQRGPGLCGTPH